MPEPLELKARTSDAPPASCWSQAFARQAGEHCVAGIRAGHRNLAGPQQPPELQDAQSASSIQKVSSLQSCMPMLQAIPQIASWLLLKSSPSLSLSLFLSALQASSFRIWASRRPRTTLQAAMAQLGGIVLAPAGTIQEHLLEMQQLARNMFAATTADVFAYPATSWPTKRLGCPSPWAARGLTTGRWRRKGSLQGWRGTKSQRPPPWVAQRLTPKRGWCKDSLPWGSETPSALGGTKAHSREGVIQRLTPLGFRDSLRPGTEAHSRSPF